MTENNTNIDNKEKVEEILEENSIETTDVVAGMAHESETGLKETINKEQQVMHERRKIIDVKDLHVSFNTYAGEVKAVRGISFDIHEGETLAIVGESGSGKTVASKAILQILPKQSAVIKEGSSIKFLDEEVLEMSRKRIKDYQGSDVAMIFQDPMTSLNPTMKIGKQIGESLKLHTKLSNDEIKKETVRLLDLVNIPNPEDRVKQYPHELSGGMRQRVMIAIALACNPKVILADEPTTALDVTIQAQILDLLRVLKEKNNTATVLVTHDLGVVADFADRIQVMYAGEIMETGTVTEIFGNAKHPYTWALLMSVPRLDSKDKETLYALGGTPPDLLLDIPGCPFAPRCDYAMEICKEQKPPTHEFSETHCSNCWLHHELAPEVERPY